MMEVLWLICPTELIALLLHDSVDRMPHFVSIILTSIKNITIISFLGESSTPIKADFEISY